MRVLPAMAVAPGQPVVESVVVGVLAGVLAAAVMDWPMSRQPEGFTPAYIATGVLTRTPHESVSLRNAMIVHHLAGGLAGVLYGLLALGLAVVVPPITTSLGLNLLAHLLAVVGVVVFIYGFFAHVVLPRAGGRSYEEEATAVRGQWLRSALVFGLTLALAVPLLWGSFVG